MIFSQIKGSLPRLSKSPVITTTNNTIAPTIVGTTLFSAQDTLNFFKETSQMGLDARTIPEEQRKN